MGSRVKEIINRIGKDLKEFLWAGVVFLIYYLIVHSLYDAFCPLLVTTGIPCAGCGLTRAALYLLQGQLARAAYINPSIFLIIIFLLYCGYFRYIKGSKIKGFSIGLAMLVVSMLVIYFCRMYLYFPERVPYVYHRNNVLAGEIPGYSDWISRTLNQIQTWRGSM